MQCGGPLGVVEVSGDGDHRVRDGFPEILLRVVLELADDQRGELLGGVDLAVKLAVKLRLALAHLALHEIDNLLGLRHRVLLGERADDRFVPSNKITDGVMRSLSAFGMICGLP